MTDDTHHPAPLHRRRRPAAVRGRERREPARAAARPSGSASRSAATRVDLTGTAEQLERATPVVQGLLDLAPDGRAGHARRRLPAGGGGPAERAARAPDRRRQDRAARASAAPSCPRRQGQRDYLQAISNHDIVVGIGPAGTGKTYLAVAKAVEALARKRVKRIILARPAVEAGESLGFLPGDMQAKVDPYLRPLYDALEDMMPHERVQRALETRTIEIAPLAYMRGRTLADAFIILDEAQNATGAQMKMFLTRLGVNSKTVVTGDKTQIDLPKREDSGLMQVERILPGHRRDRVPLPARDRRRAAPARARDHQGLRGGSERLMAPSGGGLRRSISGTRCPDRIRYPPGALGSAARDGRSSPTSLFPPPAGVGARVPDVGQRRRAAPSWRRSRIRCGSPPRRSRAKARRGR